MSLAMVLCYYFLCFGLCPSSCVELFFLILKEITTFQKVDLPSSSGKKWETATLLDLVDELPDLWTDPVQIEQVYPYFT
jgi:hypothetical protein